MKQVVLNEMTIKGKHYKDNCFPSLNNLLSEATRSPYAYNKMKRDLEEVVRNTIIKDLGSWKAPCRVAIHMEFGEKNKGQLRDQSNITAAAYKIIEDALVKSKVIEDDRPTFVQYGQQHFVYVDEPYIKVLFTEAPPFEKKTK